MIWVHVQIPCAARGWVRWQQACDAAWDTNTNTTAAMAADPFIADAIAAADVDVEEMDRIYAMIRKAAQMTQVEVARKLGVGQGVVSRLERRGDMLSTLYDYLTATGADSAASS